MNYRHPVFAREHEHTGSGIFTIGKEAPDLLQGSTLGYTQFDETLDEFFARLHRSEDLRVKLGIPQMAYHAYGFPYKSYNVQHVRNIIEWARGHDLEVRTWINEESALVLIVVADPDMSEDSGMALHEYARRSARSYQSYGLSSWYEYCKFGVPVPDSWALVERPTGLFAASPDGKQFASIG